MKTIHRAEYSISGHTLASQVGIEAAHEIAKNFPHSSELKVQHGRNLMVVKVWFNNEPWELCTWLAGNKSDTDELIETNKFNPDHFLDVTSVVCEARWRRSHRRESAFQDDIDSGRAAAILRTTDF